jgi:hypothetical protein
MNTVPGSLPHFTRPHARNRSSTVSSFASIQQSSQPPPPPTPLRYGQSKTLTLWVSEPNSQTSSSQTSVQAAGNVTNPASAVGANALNIAEVVLNHDSWPGVSAGDVIYVRAASGPAKSSASSSKSGVGTWDANTAKNVIDNMNGFLFVVGQEDGQKHGGAQVGEYQSCVKFAFDETCSTDKGSQSTSNRIRVAE